MAEPSLVVQLQALETDMWTGYCAGVERTGARRRRAVGRVGRYLEGRTMPCVRCEIDPQPPGFGSPRKCAFDDAGNFEDDNWNCGTIDMLLRDIQLNEVQGMDETMQVVYGGGEDSSGWLVLTRYKRRGKTSAAMYMGDFWPAHPLTLAIAERFVVMLKKSGRILAALNTERCGDGMPARR